MKISAPLMALGAAGVVAALPTTTAETADQLRPESPPRLVSISFSGSGCPQGRAPRVIDTSGADDDDLAFRFDKDSFRAESPGSRRTLNCQAHLNTAGVSAGWQMAVSDVAASGRAVRLRPGATMRYYATVFFSQSAQDTLTLEGQLKNTRSDTIENNPVTIQASSRSNSVWGPCTTEGGSPGILNVNFRVTLPDEGDNAFEVDTERWNFRWRRC